MINEKEFVSIINKLKSVNDFVDETNCKAKKLNDSIISDFFNASSLMISHESIVVDLLKDIFGLKEGDDVLSWWLYELDYGRKFKLGDLTENGTAINLTTAEKLYKYLTRGSRKHDD